MSFSPQATQTHLERRTRVVQHLVLALILHTFNHLLGGSLEHAPGREEDSGKREGSLAPPAKHAQREDLA